MADVRSLLRSERAARRIQHPYATYSTTGTLICRVCNTQLKSESLWDTHLRSTQHAMKLQKMKDAGMAPAVDTESSTLNNKKRKANSDSPIGDKKKIKAGAGLAGFIPEGFFDDGMEPSNDNGNENEAEEAEHEQGEPTHDNTKDPKRRESGPVPSGKETIIPSRPATPLKPTPTASPHPPSTTKNTQSQQSTPLQKKSHAPPPPAATARTDAEIDESEWAAFEADIAATEEQEQEQTQASISTDAVISAPALSAADVAAKSAEEEAARKREAREAELEGEKEDAVRKLEEEFAEMEGLEERVKRLREKREALRIKEDGLKGNNNESGTMDEAKNGDEDEDEDMDDDEGEDDWDGFRLR